VSRLQALDAYLSREMTDAEADALEEAMFDSPDDEDLAFVDRFARLGAKLAAHGTFEIGGTRAEIDALIAAGHDVAINDVGPPHSGTMSIDLDGDIIVTKLHLGHTDIERVDIEVQILTHGVTKTIKDALVDQSDGIIYMMCERPLAELALAAGRTIARVRRRDGAREVLGEWDLTPATP
jgi:hypothetical protein